MLIFFSFIQCSKNTEKDEYEIVNLILQKNVTAYGVKIFPPKKSLLVLQNIKNLTIVLLIAVI